MPRPKDDSSHPLVNLMLVGAVACAAICIAEGIRVLSLFDKELESAETDTTAPPVVQFKLIPA